MPKTATHSIREALRPNLGNDDWEQQVLFGNDLAPIPEIAAIGHGHISAQEIRSFLSEAEWSTYFKFAFVRNPFDRFVSVCAFLNRENPEYKSNPLQWMKLALQRPRFRARPLVRPQISQLVNESEQLAMDYVGRYESLQDSINEVLQKLELPTFELQQRNASSHADYHEYYDTELQERVGALYERDLQEFGYQF